MSSNLAECVQETSRSFSMGQGFFSAQSVDGSGAESVETIGPRDGYQDMITRCCITLSCI